MRRALRSPPEAATLDRAAQVGLVRWHDDEHLVVRSPALLGLVADWVATGISVDWALDVIEVLTDDLGALADKLAGLFVERIAGAGDLADLLRRGRPLVLQGAASTLADGLGAALAERAEAADDGGRLRAALQEIRVGAVADAEGTIHRRGEGG